MGRFDKLKSGEGMEISEVLKICLKCNTKEEASEVLREYGEQCESPEIAQTNFGYIFGYAEGEDRKKLYSLFSLSHPIFGPAFGHCDEDDKIVDALGGIIKNMNRQTGIAKLKVEPASVDLVMTKERERELEGEFKELKKNWKRWKK